MNSYAVQQRYGDFIRRTGRLASPDTCIEFLHIELIDVINTLLPGEMVLHGGAYLRYFLGSPRYSLDLDYSSMVTVQCDRDKLVTFAKDTQERIVCEFKKKGILLNTLPPRIHKGDHGLKMRFKANALKEIFPHLYQGYAKDITVNIDVDQLYREDKPEISTPTMNTTLSTLVVGESRHMARKAMAVLNRNQLRDVYDLLLYIQRGVSIHMPLIHEKMKDHPSFEEVKEAVIQKVSTYDIMSRLHQVHLPNEEELRVVKDKDILFEILHHWK